MLLHFLADTSAAGRITSFREDTPGHCISFECKLHKKCKVLKGIRKLPEDFQAVRKHRSAYFLVTYYSYLNLDLTVNCVLLYYVHFIVLSFAPTLQCE